MTFVIWTVFQTRTGDRSAGGTLTPLCHDAPGDLSPVLYTDKAEGEPGFIDRTDQQLHSRQASGTSRSVIL